MNNNMSLNQSSNSTKVIKNYAQKFRDEWLADPRFRNWLRRVEGNERNCFCRCCEVILTTKRSSIEKHSNTIKHKKAEEMLAPDPEAILPIIIKTETKQRGVLDEMVPQPIADHSDYVDGNENRNVNVVPEHFPSHSKFQEGEILYMYDQVEEVAIEYADMCESVEGEEVAVEYTDMCESVEEGEVEYTDMYEPVKGVNIEYIDDGSYIQSIKEDAPFKIISCRKNSPVKILTGRKVTKTETNSVVETESYSKSVRDTELDIFGKSIVAQMKMLPEIIAVELTHEIQKRINKIRIAVDRDKIDKQQSKKQNSQVITVAENTAFKTIHLSPSLFETH